MSSHRIPLLVLMIVLLLSSILLLPVKQPTRSQSTQHFSWTTRATSPIPRSEALGLAADGKLYVFGGFNVSLQATARSDVYEPTSNSWRRISDMPEALTHTPLVRDGDTIWFIGGFLGDHPGPSINRVWVYSISGDSWRAGPPLPAPVGAGTAAIVGRTLHAIGGTNRQNGQYSDVTSHYALDLDNPSAGWRSLAALPVARNHLGGIALNGKIYVIGGQSNGAENSTNTARVDVYDPATDRWSRIADMPRGLGHITASVLPYNGRIIVIGGSINGGTGGLASDAVLLYDPQANVWLHLPDLPAGRKTPVADFIGRELFVSTGAGYTRDQTWAATLPGSWESAKALPVALGEVAGGIIGNKLYLVGEGNSATLAYNLSDNTWSSITALAKRSFAGNHHAAEVVGGKLYLFGGLGSGAGKVQIYDPAANSWSLGADMPFAAGSSASALIDGKVYVAGGIVGSSTTKRVARYDPLANSWQELPPMPLGRNHAAAASDGQKFYIFGGRGPGSGDSNVVANGFDTVQIYDPATNSWLSSADATSGVPPLPQARGGMGKAVFVGGEFYVIGGETDSGAGATANKVYSRVDIYNPQSRSWRLGTPMPTARHGIFPLAIGDRIYVAGGGIKAANSQSTTLERYNPELSASNPLPTPTKIFLPLTATTSATQTTSATSVSSARRALLVVGSIILLAGEQALRDRFVGLGFDDRKMASTIGNIEFAVIDIIEV
jgi:N-acetylneuraminic acid mutarotase